MKKLINLIIVIAIAALVVAQDKKVSSKENPPAADSTTVKVQQVNQAYEKQSTKLDSILLEKKK